MHTKYENNCFTGSWDMLNYVFSSSGDLVSKIKSQGQCWLHSMNGYASVPLNHWNGSIIGIIDIELCHFHWSGPIGLHWENTKWQISRKRAHFGSHEWQFCILLFIPVILVCHKPWFENVLLWPTFWPLPIFDLKDQTEVKRSYLKLGHHSLYAYQI